MVSESLTENRSNCPIAGGRRWWAAVAIASCIGTVMISAPLMFYAVHLHRENLAEGDRAVVKWQEINLQSRLLKESIK